MLNWLSQLFRRRPQVRSQRRSPSPVRVEHDDKMISVRDGKGGLVTLGWTEVASVTVVTNDRGPIETDLFWILADRDGRRVVRVPMGADGEHELLLAMQQRLAGFDNMAVVEAMSSVENGEFQIWPAAEMT